MKERAVRAVTLIMFIYFRLTAVKVVVKGTENLPPPGESCELTSDHLSYVDPALIWWVLGRVVRFWMKKDISGIEWLDKLFVKAAVRLFGIIPIERKRQLTKVEAEAVFDESAELLRQGEIIGAFPKGTRKGRLDKRGYTAAKVGTAELALRTRTDVLPVAITNTEGLANPIGLFFVPIGLIVLILPWIPWRRRRVVVSIGKLYTLERNGATPRDRRREGVQTIMDKIESLQPAQPTI